MSDAAVTQTNKEIIMNTKDMIEVMQAYDNGKAIELRRNNEYEWSACRNPVWNWFLFEYRIKPDTKDEIDWSHVHERWKFMARDGNGNAYLFESEPKVLSGSDVWLPCDGDYYRVSHILSSYVKGTCDWTESLAARPIEAEE